MANSGCMLKVELLRFADRVLPKGLWKKCGPGRLLCG